MGVKQQHFLLWKVVAFTAFLQMVIYVLLIKLLRLITLFLCHKSLKMVQACGVHYQTDKNLTVADILTFICLWQKETT